MRPLALTFLPVLLLGLLLSAAASRAAETVYYGFHPDFPPFSYLENGQPAGFEVELLQAALQGSDYRLQPKAMAWDTILIRLRTRGLHVTSGMAKTPQREQAYLFTSSPSVTLTTFIFQNTSAAIQSLEELRHSKAAVKRDSLYQRDLERLDLFDIKLFDSQQQAMEALWAGNVQALCTADKIGHFIARSGNFSGISATGSPLRTTSLYYALRKDQQALRQAIDKGLERLVRSGAFGRIYRKWFVPTLETRQQQRLIQRAKEGADDSYVPYTLKARGAAVLSRSGRFYAGGLIEVGDPKLNRSPLTVALQRAASKGDTDILAAVSLSSQGRAIPPTADERRLLYQFGRGVQVVIEPEIGSFAVKLISELLPSPDEFAPWIPEKPGNYNF